MWGHFDSTVEVFRAFFVVDCESASQAIEHDGGFDLAFVLQEVRDLRWTPLTGKKPDWRPPCTAAEGPQHGS